MRSLIFCILLCPLLCFAEDGPLILQPLGKSACYISESQRTVYAALVIRNVSEDTHRIVTASDGYGVVFDSDSEIEAGRGGKVYQVGMGYNPVVITLKSGEKLIESPAGLKILELPPGYAGALEVIEIPIEDLEDGRTFDDSASFIFTYNVREDMGKAHGLWTGRLQTKELAVRDFLRTE
ncbi:MAG: hypothetical protein AAF546_08850 [Verrucomicrobiota bacterium]